MLYSLLSDGFWARWPDGFVVFPAGWVPLHEGDVR